MKTYTLQGLDCANCAAGLEKTLAAHPGVRKVSIDFATLSLKIDTDQMELIKDLIKKEEPDIQVIGKNTGESLSPEESRNKNGNLRMPLAILGISAGLTALGLILDTLGLLPEQPLLRPLWYGILYLLAGWPVLHKAVSNILKGQWLDETFLMAIATLGALALGEWEEAVGVMVFWRTGELLQEQAVAKSRQTIRSLAEIRGNSARKKQGQTWLSVPLKDLIPGDIIQLHPGDRVPVDGKILHGEGSLDTSALTGEPLPRHGVPGMEISGGYLNISGLLEVEVLKPEGESAAARILELVENALHSKAQPEKLITRFARIYTPVVVLSALLIAVIPPLFIPGAPFEEWIRRALILLVISCPCALVLGIPLSYFAGLGGAARKGILFKGANFMETLGNARSITFDKTGTLTQGVFALQSLHPTPGTTAEELLALAVEAEGPSPHPLAHSLRRAWSGLPLALPETFTERPGFGVEARWPHQILWAGNRRYMEELGHLVPITTPVTLGTFSGTEIHVADQTGYKGWIHLGDAHRPELGRTLKQLRGLGVDNLTILSGDQSSTVEKISMEYGFDSAQGSLLPGDKLKSFEGSMTTHPGPHVFVGDGINDSPVLARADVGISLGIKGTEAALEASDVALMDDDLSGIPRAIVHCRKVNRLVYQNIAFALGIKVIFLTLGILGMANLWMAVIADVGAALLVVANSLRGLR